MPPKQRVITNSKSDPKCMDSTTLFTTWTRNTRLLHEHANTDVTRRHFVLHDINKGHSERPMQQMEG